MTREELDEVLRLHALWLAGEAGGEQADLSGADLRMADYSAQELAVALVDVYCPKVRSNEK